MKLTFSLLTAISFVSLSVSNPLLATIKDIKSLNTLNSIITSSKNLTALFDTARDFTFLAPSNAALDTWFARDPFNTPALLATTLLKYHLLHGRFTTEAFTDESQFAHSFLDNSTYANVTGGQVVEIVKRDGQPVFSSGNKTLSSITLPPVSSMSQLSHILKRPIYQGLTNDAYRIEYVREATSRSLIEFSNFPST